MAPQITIACGGTGGHLFPGIAVAGELTQRGCAVTLLVSPKDVDQQAVKSLFGMEIVTLPAVGLSRGRGIAFARGFIQSYRAAANYFKEHPPQAALAMGGFTSAPPVLAAKRLGAKTFLHESNTIPGRANRWLSRIVDQAFIGFPQSRERLRARNVTVTGTPVRPQFQPRDPAACRESLGLDPLRPVLLVMGGSQGASAINDLVLKSLPFLAEHGTRTTQIFHLTGSNDFEKVRRAYAEKNLNAVVHPFFSEIGLALGAATVCVSRAGASSLAEIAAMRVPSVLIPYPAATDNHQFHNARAFERTGAARLLEQNGAKPEVLGRQIVDLFESAPMRENMQTALAQWHRPGSAREIAEIILAAIGATDPLNPKSQVSGSKENANSKYQFASAAAWVGIWSSGFFGIWDF